MPCRVQCPSGAKVTLVTLMAARVKSWQQHRVITSSIQLAIGLIRQLRVGQHATRLQLKVLQMEYLVIHGALVATLVKTQVFLQLPVGGGLMVSLPLVNLVGDKGVQHLLTQHLFCQLALA